MSAENVENRNYYELLGVPETATVEQIKEVYREIARVYHPDSNFYNEIVPTKVKPEQLEMFKIITAAYNTLTDEKKRAEYDTKIKATIIRLKDWEDDNSDFFNKNAMVDPPKPRVRTRTMTGVFGRADILNAMSQEDLCATKTFDRPPLANITRVRKASFVSFIFIFLGITGGTLISAIVYALIHR